MLLPLEAKQIKLNGTGRATDLCRTGLPIGAMDCLVLVKLRAEYDAQQDCEFTCQKEKGTIRYDTIHNSAFCTPGSIPQGIPSFVQCEGRCTATCEVPDKKGLQ